MKTRFFFLVNVFCLQFRKYKKYIECVIKISHHNDGMFLPLIYDVLPAFRTSFYLTRFGINVLLLVYVERDTQRQSDRLRERERERALFTNVLKGFPVHTCAVLMNI